MFANKFRLLNNTYNLSSSRKRKLILNKLPKFRSAIMKKGEVYKNKPVVSKLEILFRAIPWTTNSFRTVLRSSLGFELIFII
jgi:hypothetical protein